MNTHFLNSRTTVLIAAFSGIYLLFRIIPTFSIIGVSGGTFTLGDVLLPIYGILLGPFIGSCTIILGTFLSYLYGKPALFFGLDFLPGVVNVIIIGFLYKRKKLIPFILYISLLIIFMINPYTLNYISFNFIFFEAKLFFAWMHVLALLLLISPFSLKAKKWIISNNVKKITGGLFLLSLIGIMAQHLMGNILYESIFGLVLEVPKSAFIPIWHSVFFLYPFERSITVIIATLIGLPLVRFVKKIKIPFLPN